jgi:trehalose 6-phosphate synthase/phosphatase
MARLILISNRLPVTVELVRGDVSVTESAGGLATGLRGPHERSGGLWLGWPGETSRLDEAQRGELDRRLAELRAVPLHLSADEVSQFYEGFSNGVLWPVFHYLLERLPNDNSGWEMYARVNERFADLAAEHYQPGDLVWVHDYQLALVPALLRKRIPDARIGFFLHIPFPSAEVYRTLPCREAMLEGLLGADLIGFHTLGYARHFANALLQVLGVSTDVDQVRWSGRTVRLGAFPMSVDASAFCTLARSPEVLAEVEEIRRESGGCRILLGIDRLDYTKGIERRLLAIERLLEREPELRGSVRFVQVAVPSRTMVKEYASFRDHVNEMVGRINGAHGTLGSVPVHYLFRGFSQQRLAAMYLAADVMVVTPLRDGMNLVAKEFVACRHDEGGVLVLSELAGAACELGEALLVNPYDVDATAAAISRALRMSDEERRTRMRALRGRVFQYDVHHWAGAFLGELSRPEAYLPAPDLRLTPRREVAALTERLREAPRLICLLDYDGTLTAFAGRPELAGPDRALLALLVALAERPDTFVHIISGRARDVLERWLGGLPLALHAEHGLWSRAARGGDWEQVRDVPTDWKDRVRELLQAFVVRTPGAFIEEKSASIAWHYRMADDAFGERQAKDLQVHLAGALSNVPVTVLPGNKVVEVKPHGIHKGLVLERLGAEAEGAVMLAMGDDQTDEDLFAALPETGVAVHVGPKPTRAAIRLADVGAARALLLGIAREDGS